MKITVVALTSATPATAYTVTLEPKSTINDLKTQLNENHPYKIPFPQQLLLLPTSTSPPSNSKHEHFSSLYGPLCPLLDSNPSRTLAQFGIKDGSTVYLTLLLRVLLSSGSSHETEVLCELKWKCTLRNLRDQVKSLTKTCVTSCNVTWGDNVKFGPYQEYTIESLCDVWNNPTVPFIVVVSARDRLVKKPASSDLEDGQLDTVSEDEEGDMDRPGALFCYEGRRKYNDVGPLRDKRRSGSFFGLQFKKSGSRNLVNELDFPGAAIPLPEGISGFEFVKDSDVKFIILWLGVGLEEMLTRYDFHKKKSTRCVVVKGERDLSTYCFLRKLKAEFKNIPICAVTDCDPCSLKVLAFLRHPLSEFPPKLQRQFGAKWKEKADVYGAKIEIKWIGLRPSYKKFNQLETVPMTAKCAETAKQFLKEDGFVRMFPEWAEELRLMLERQEVAKVAAFSEFGDEFFSSVYLLEELGKHRCSGVKFNSSRR